MALINSFEPTTTERTSRVHDATYCKWFTFVAAGKSYLQLQTYGSENRLFKDTVSQTIQLGEVAAGELKRVIEDAFPSLTTPRVGPDHLV
jgi:hypothetical protein